MIARIPRRLGFTPFRRSRLHRLGGLSIRASLDPTVDAVHVVFSTPKRIGSAVVRNRIRRRLRELMRARAHRLPHGWYLVGVEREVVDNDWGQLGTTVDRLLTQVLTDESSPSGVSTRRTEGVL